MKTGAQLSKEAGRASAYSSIYNKPILPLSERLKKPEPEKPRKSAYQHYMEVLAAKDAIRSSNQ